MKYGYHPKISQSLYKVHFNIKIRPKEDIDIQILDDSFKSIFDIECDKYLCNKKDDIYIAFIDRYLLLANVLQSFSGIPAFYIDNITEYTVADNGQVEFDAYIPFLEYINKNMQIQLYQEGLKIIELILEKKMEILYHFLDELQKKVIQKFRAFNAQNDSTIPVLEGAFHQNIPFLQLQTNIFQLGWGSRSILLKASAVDDDSFLGTMFAHNKLISKNILKKIGCPIPKGFLIDNKNNLKGYAKKLDFPVIIKPMDRDRSEGVTTDIKSLKHLKQAYNEATKFSKNIMIEEHVEGDVYRIALIHNHLMFVTKRKPKGVYGDGKNSIEALIDNSNYVESKKAPWLRLKSFPKDSIALECLSEQNVTLQTILDQGQYVYLRKIQSNEEGGIDEVVTTSIHPANVEVAKRISNVFRLRSIGIDFISTDITIPWHENNGKILEINFSPAIANRFQSWGHEYSKKFISSCFPMSARIPIDVYVGGKKAWDVAEKKMQELKDKEMNVYITDHQSTYNVNQEKIEMITENFYQRIQSLLMDTTLDYLIVIIHTDELFENGVPFDQISNVIIVDHELKTFKGNKPLSQEKVNRLINSFNFFLRSKT